MVIVIVIATNHRNRENDTIWNNTRNKNSNRNREKRETTNNKKRLGAFGAESFGAEQFGAFGGWSESGGVHRRVTIGCHEN